MNIPEHELNDVFFDAWLCHRISDDFYDKETWPHVRNDDRSMYIAGGEL